MKLRVSAVVATYNRAHLIRETIEAIWGQTIQPDEIVVSDDSSTDNTIEVLEELKKKIPVLVILKNNQNSGGTPNCNKAVNAASGDVIAWCSDDDRWYPTHLEKSISYLNENSEVSLVFSSFSNTTVYEDGKTETEFPGHKSRKPFRIDRNSILPYFTKHLNWPFHASTLVFSRKAWKQVGEFNDTVALADTEWFVRCAVSHVIAYLPHYGVENRRHLGNSGNWSNKIGSVRMQREVLESVRNFMKLAGMEIFDEEAVFVLRRQYTVWTNKFRILLIRMFIARSRAGKRSVAAELASLILEVTPKLELIPAVVRRIFSNGVFRLLYFLQKFMPGGRSKYDDLGRHVPL